MHFLSFARRHCLLLLPSSQLCFEMKYVTYVCMVHAAFNEGVVIILEGILAVKRETLLEELGITKVYRY